MYHNSAHIKSSIKRAIRVWCTRGRHIDALSLQVLTTTSTIDSDNKLDQHLLSAAIVNGEDIAPSSSKPSPPANPKLSSSISKTCPNPKNPKKEWQTTQSNSQVATHGFPCRKE
ncbi:hypothetical protein Leryth_027375 [Lithospermum erythrorhizon]|nr:hypothetical protein Leryth_027375 [Lithospermum erythrorhizon]